MENLPPPPTLTTMDNIPPPPWLTTMENLPPPPPPPPPLTATNNLPPPPPFAYLNNLPPPPLLTTAKNLPPLPPPPGTTIIFPPSPPRTPTENLPPPPPLPPPHLPQPIRCSSALASPSLSTTLQHLTSLLQLTTATLTALPSALPTHPTPSTLPCPHNPSHLIPPSSLFSHYLSCPSTVEIPQIPPTTNFFYQNCPSAVKLPSDNPSPQTATPALPPVLLNECDVSNPQNPWTNGDDSCAKFFLPSEIWHLRSELESWGFGGRVPISCSCTVLRAFVGLRHCRLSFLREWIVERSLKYGIVVDFPFADRIIVLVVLCLKALTRYTWGIMSNADVKTQPNQNFAFPVLGEVLSWLGLQFSVLYGEVSARSFAIDAISKCVLETASRCCLFPLDEKCVESSEIKEVFGKNKHFTSVISIDEVGRKAKEIGDGETVEVSRIFISQVEDAVIKLHQRSVMEEHITTLRDSQLLSPPYQRYMAHERASKIAEEERKRRPDYKPIIEHDGLLSQRLNDTDTTGKRKTRRELLAEERDYRRRRMSYRGKKLKRSTLEVTRDIIEEYMEAIKEAGGITGNDTNVQKTQALVPEKLRMQTVDDSPALTKRSENENRNPSPYPRKGFFSRHDSEQFEQYSKRKSHARSEHALEGSFRYVETEPSSDREKSYHVESFVEGSKQRSYKRTRESPEQNYRRRYADKHEHKRDDHKRYRDERKREHNDRKRFSDDEDSTRRKRQRYEDDREYDRHGNRKKSKSKSGNSSSRYEPLKFEDRYDPADSENSYENLD